VPIGDLIVCLLLIAMHTASAELISGYVVGVTDGDTLSLLVKQQPRKVRIVGIDAPERRHPQAPGSAPTRRSKFGADLSLSGKPQQKRY